MPQQAPTPVQPVSTPVPPITTPPPPVPPAAPVAMAPHSHPNVALIAIACLLIGAIAGAAGMFFVARYALIQFGPAATTSAASTAAEDQAATDATASSYSNVDTNPLGDVQTNPF